jgi:predicted transcriptional regulator
MKTPCEIVLWSFLPSLRRELVKSMIKNGLERKEIAKIFNITEASICQYLKSKRGMNFQFDDNMKKQIQAIAVKISKSKNKETIISETCKLCSLFKKQKLFCKLHKEEVPLLAECCLEHTTCVRS